MHELEGSPSAIRKLITESLLPQLQAMAARRNAIDVAGSAGKPLNRAEVESHHFPELCFCLLGEAEIWCGSDVRRLQQGDVLVIPPQVAHSTSGAHCITRNPSLASSRLLWVRSFPYGAVLNLCRTSGGLHRSTVHQVFLQQRIHASVERLIEELQQPQFGHREMANCHITEALTWICRGTDVGSAVIPEVKARSTSAGEDGLALQAARFIQESFDSPLNLDVIARAAGTNKSQLCREFRRHYNVTVMEHVARVRIDASKRLLQARMRVADAAQFVGFPDPYHFSRVFKKIAGQSPKQFSDAQHPIEKAHSKNR